MAYLTSEARRKQRKDDLQGSVEYKLADDWIGGWRVYHIDYEQNRVIRAKETWQDW